VLVPTVVPPLSGDLNSRIVQLAQSWLGVPYVFGGCSRGGVDCSCLVENVYAAVGIHLPRVAVDQFNATSSIADPQPGDLVFFANTYEPGISHVGIYIGDGLQINAPTTGQVVSIAPVFTGYWGAHFAGAHRVRA
jgi:cell wall-associated NlpC family hydrolase